jgi:hypothetical protein
MDEKTLLCKHYSKCGTKWKQSTYIIALHSHVMFRFLSFSSHSVLLLQLFVLADTSSDQSCWTTSSSLPPPPSSNKIVTPIIISSCLSFAEIFILRRRRLTERCNILWRRGAFQIQMKICSENAERKKAITTFMWWWRPNLQRVE